MVGCMEGEKMPGEENECIWDVGGERRSGWWRKIEKMREGDGPRHGHQAPSASALCACLAKLIACVRFAAATG